MVFLKKRLLALLLFSASFSYAQTLVPFDSLYNRKAKFIEKYPQEKVHLHFDKPFYALGDTIWFAGYVVNAIDNIPADQSKILHVDLINPKDSVIKSLQVLIDLGFASGDFSLTDSLPAGRYRIRAYTNWMRNFSDDFFFDKQLSIIKPSETSLPRGQAISKPPVTVEFFPEGMYLVNGLKSVVGFTTWSINGGVPVTGKLIDEQDHKVTTFKSTHAGMGSFSFTPQKDKTYRAVVTLPDGSEKTTALRPALPSGCVLNADTGSPDSIHIALTVTADWVNKANVVLMVSSNDKPIFNFKTGFPDACVNLAIPKNKLPPGLLELSLFDERNQPLALRLCFNNYLQAVNIAIPDLKPTYTQGELSQLNLKATDIKGRPVTGSFSISVTNIDDPARNENNETTIFSNLLLSSDLKNEVTQPNYYFSQTSPDKSKVLDDLLLTHSYWRFSWRDLIAGKSPALTYPRMENLLVNGRITSAKKGRIDGVPVTLLIGQLGAGQLLDTLTDAKGHFTFRIPDELAGLPMMVQAKQKKQDLLVSLDPYHPPAVAPSRVADVLNFSDENYLSSLDAYSKIVAQAKASNKKIAFKPSTHLKEVVIHDYNPRPKLTNSTSNNLNGAGQADKVILPETLEKMPDLSTLDVLLPGTLVTPGKKTLVLRSNTGTHLPAVLFIIDGADYGNEIPDISPRDIESLEFLKTPAYAGIYGIRGSGGVVLITTKKGKYPYVPDPTTPKNVIKFTLPIYSAREFYSPLDHKAADSSTSPHATLFWKPNVITDKDGKASIQYYNTGAPGNYRIVIEGIGAKGNLCRQVFSYKVE